MSKKQDAFYFDNFVACADYSVKAARLLKEILSDYRPDEISGRLDEMHELEHQADGQRHKITDNLAKSFITPIEREDIAALIQLIDEVTDNVEEVLIRIYINNVQTIRPEALPLVYVMSRCCEGVYNLLKEFADFKHSSKLKQEIININSLEEEADSLYISSMRKLHTEETDVRQIIAWREIYDYLEKCADTCEHVADTVGSVVMKNS